MNKELYNLIFSECSENKMYKRKGNNTKYGLKVVKNGKKGSVFSYLPYGKLEAFKVCFIKAAKNKS
ncbi:TPA: hypothetical protein QCW96_003224 [Bacillus pacificus]|uniref:hypothetical protein n=1 Tax=Bacillus cereus group TaxID=86661 RepID=UPI00384A0B6F|nr:hypothetical protein [Bacillus pacificus]